MLAKLTAIALNTYRENVRARLLHGLFALATATAGYSLVVGAYAFKDTLRVVSDLGGASISLYGIVVAVVLGATSLHRELELKTAFPILARPVSRSTYLVGKFLGTFLTLFAFVVSNCALLLFALAILGGIEWSRVLLIAAILGGAATLTGYRIPRLRSFVPLIVAVVWLCAGWFLSSVAPDDRRVLLGSTVLCLAEISIVIAVANVFASFSSPFLFGDADDRDCRRRPFCRHVGPSACSCLWRRDREGRQGHLDDRPQSHDVRAGSSAPDRRDARKSPFELLGARRADVRWLFGAPTFAFGVALSPTGFYVKVHGRRFGLFAVVLVLVLVGGASLVWRMNVEGAKAMARSDEHFDQGRLLDAVLYSRRAASLYVPFAEHVRRADARLDFIAHGAEAAKLERVALIAWEAIRAVELQRPTTLARNARRLELANRRIALLITSSGGSPLASQVQVGRRVLDELERSGDIGAYAGEFGWAMAQPLCFAAFLLGLMVVGREWLGRGSLSKLAWGAGCLSLVGAVGWTLLLLFA
ncbi:MAG: ABC transporter permease subunit [Polyangiaceae bacterium]